MSNTTSPAIAPSPNGSSSINTPLQSMMPKPIASNVTKIVTSKEWVLPPRPKPGRKPSADTPATKRKAQNRAAQRAFRERRATRVTELEGRLSEVEKEKEINELNFKNIVNKLKNENKFLLKALNDIKMDYSNFKNKVISQQSNKNILNSNNNTPAVFSNGQVTSPSPLNYFKLTNAQSPDGIDQNYKFNNNNNSHNHTHNRRDSQPFQGINLQNNNNNNQYPQQQTLSSISPANSTSRSPNDLFSPNPTIPSSNSSTTTTQENFSCGVCIKDDCICEEVGLRPKHEHPEQQPQQPQQQLPTINTSSIQLNGLKPMKPVSLKRKASQEIEIDYTEKFKSSKLKSLPKLKKFKKLSKDNSDDTAKEFSTMFDKITDQDFESPMEQCGFCSDESNCVCAQAAKQAANAITELQNHSRRESQQQQQIQIPVKVSHNHQHSSALPPISRHSSSTQVFNKLPVMHPGPSVEIPEHHRSSISTPKETTNTNNEESKSGCTGNPGTCSQCQMDPMSTLFCTTVAAKAEGEEDSEEQQPTTDSKQQSTIPTPIQSSIIKSDNQSPVSPPISTHSSKVSSPMNTQSSSLTNQEEELNSLTKKFTQQPPSVSASNAQTPPSTTISSISGPSGNGTVTTPGGGSAKGIYIPCADAYKTLSRHKEFNSVDFSTLVGKLNTRGMQVEVQSVANVLRELDRRLYS